LDVEAQRLAQQTAEHLDPLAPADHAIKRVGVLTTSLRQLDEVLQAQPQPAQTPGSMPGQGQLLVALDEACAVVWNALAELGATTALGDDVVDTMRKRFDGVPNTGRIEDQ
jgi:hypothetical protein